MQDFVLPKQRGGGERRFIGYDRGEVERALAALEPRIWDFEPHVAVFHDTILAPVSRIKVGKFVGGTFSGGRYVEELALRRGPTAWPVISAPAAAPEPRGSLEAAWYGGMIFNHFGHFVVEGLARVLDVRVAQSQLPILFFKQETLPRFTRYMRQTFAHLGIDPARCVLVDHPVAVGELSAVEPFISLQGHVNVGMRRTFSPPPASVNRRAAPILYLSRSSLKKGRRAVNEAEIERTASVGGARVVVPERSSIERQIADLAAASVVAGTEGSAFHALVLAQGRQDTIMLCGGFPNLTYLLQDELGEGDATYVNAASEQPSGNRRAAWTATPSAITAFGGLIGEACVRHRAAPVGRRPLHRLWRRLFDRGEVGKRVRG